MRLPRRLGHDQEVELVGHLERAPLADLRRGRSRPRDDDRRVRRSIADVIGLLDLRSFRRTIGTC